MNYGEIKTIDIANGTGVRTTLFVSGCTHHCEGCFNSDTWDFNYGKPFTKEVEDEIIESLRPAYVTGLTVLGGEPMEVANQRALRPFLQRVKTLLPDKTIWIYSGYLWDEINDVDNKRCHGDDTDTILSLIDILVDGEFVLGLKDITLNFRGSSNQRIIDVKASREEGKIVLDPLNN